MKTIFKFFIVAIILVYISSIDYYTDTLEALKNYPNQVKKGGKNPKYLYFKMKKNLPRGIDYYTKILYSVLNTAGIRPYFVNLKDEILLGLIPEDANINEEMILELKDRFKEVVEDIILKLKLEK
jgi:hypothetical protein